MTSFTSFFLFNFYQIATRSVAFCLEGAKVVIQVFNTIRNFPRVAPIYNTIVFLNYAEYMCDIRAGKN
jgi:hypothetical protein